jgi:hypothetical protein
MKQCHSCKETKPLDQFYKSKTRKDGVQSRCIHCDQTKYRNRSKKLPNDLKTRFMYHAVIEESELEKTSYLTYREILEILENVLAIDQVA